VTISNTLLHMIQIQYMELVSSALHHTNLSQRHWDMGMIHKTGKGLQRPKFSPALQRISKHDGRYTSPQYLFNTAYEPPIGSLVAFSSPLPNLTRTSKII